MVYVTDLKYNLEQRLVNKLDLMMNLCERTRPENDNLMINEGAEGSGKCQTKGSKILMADGEWKNIEEVKEGDLVLSPQQDGSTVFAKVSNLNDWECNEVYDVVELNKKKEKLYSCSSNHLIPLNVVQRLKRNGQRNKSERKWRMENLESREIAMKPKGFKINSTTISSHKIKKFMGRENCEIEPYTLGVYLGDGSFSNQKGKRSLRISNSNLNIIEEVSSYYPVMNISRKQGKTIKEILSYGFSLNGELAILLQKYGLEGKGSGEKFIPKEALLSDEDYRIRLLAGLIDTDGYYHNGGYEYTSKSKTFIENIKDLVYSLGGRCGKIREMKKKIKSISFEGKYYSLSIYLGSLKLPLKKEYKIKKDKSFYLSSNRISIDCIKRKEPERVYGFSIDSPSKLYITDNWMVTHNSNSSIAEAYYVKYKTGRDAHLFFRLEPLINFAKMTEKKIIIWDEPSLDALKSDAMATMNRDLHRLLMTVRKKRHFMIFNLTKFWKFSEYVVVDRSNALIQIYAYKRIEPGRFRFIPHRNLEKLYNGYTKHKMRMYNETTTFRGSFPEVMEKKFDKMDFFVNKIPHATYKIYKEEKDKSIESIGEHIVVGKRETDQIERMKRIQKTLWYITKKYKIPISLVTTAAGCHRSAFKDWAHLPVKLPESLENLYFKANLAAS
jgi:hypothetical protein